MPCSTRRAPKPCTHHETLLLAGHLPVKTVRVSVAGRNLLRLVVTDAQDGVTNDVADWPNPSLVCS